MKIKLSIIIGVFLFCAVNIFAQNGGKAEPLRIGFDKGKSQKTVSGSLKGDEQYEYIFGANAGQKVKINILSTAPRGKFHAFKVLGADEIDFTSEYDNNYNLKFTAPETGDYLIFVNLRPTEKVRAGKFSLTLIIK
jgi:hypothetical protein